MLGRLVRVAPPSFEPAEWFIVFRYATDNVLVRWLTFGRMKHVACFGFVKAADAWVFFEPAIDRTDLTVIPDAKADEAIGEATDGATVVRIDAKVRRRGRWRPVFLCTVAVAHLAGVNTSALRPNRLFADCLAQGGSIVAEPAWATAAKKRRRTRRRRRISSRILSRRPN